MHPANPHSLPLVVRTSIVLLLLCSAAVSGKAQSTTTELQPPQVGTAFNAIEWVLVLDGRTVDWPLEQAFPADSVQVVADQILATQQFDGYVHAVLDSLVTEPPEVANTRETITLYVERGPRLEVRSVRLEGVRAFEPDALLREFETRPGRVLNPLALETDLDALLRRYDEVGHVLAQANIAELEVDSEGDDAGIDLVVEVDEGERLDLAEIVLEGGKRTRAKYVTLLTGLRLDEPIVAYDPEAIQRQLDETGVFDNVQLPLLAVDANGEAILTIPVTEDAPGAFDAVIGYLPPATPNDRGSVVGNVNILLRNLLGMGRRFEFRFNRLPARVTRLNIEAADPYLFGLPLGVEATFAGYQKDSTYTKQQFRFETAYRLVEGLEAFVTLSREATRPGADTLVNIPRSNSWFAGLGFRYQRLDRVLNPRRGWRLSVNVEQGRKLRSLISLRQDSTRAFGDESLRQQRLTLDSRAYLPVSQRHVAAFGFDGAVLVSSAYDDSDLFRLGGAQTLRGYNEEQYRGSVVGRGLLEWRYLLDRTSFLFVFTDLGYVSEPPLDETIRSTAGEVLDLKLQQWLPGYGFGMQFGTSAGMFSVSLALNPSEGLGTKVHVGITLGL